MSSILLFSESISGSLHIYLSLFKLTPMFIQTSIEDIECSEVKLKYYFILPYPKVFGQYSSSIVHVWWVSQLEAITTYFDYNCLLKYIGPTHKTTIDILVRFCTSPFCTPTVHMQTEVTTLL